MTTALDRPRACLSGQAPPFGQSRLFGQSRHACRYRWGRFAIATCRLWVVVGIALSLVCGGRSSGRRAMAQGEGDPVIAAWGAFPETYACGQCHDESQAVPNHRFDDPSHLKRGDFSRQNEMHRWVREDTHAVARLRVEPLTPQRIESERARLKTLLQVEPGSAAAPVDSWLGASNALSRRMCEALGFDVDSPEGYARFAASCLTCHGGYDPKQASQKGFTRTEDLSLAQPGVSCLGCHQQVSGDGAGVASWIVEHASLTDPQQRGWRMKSPQEKADLGMRDLVSTSAQAELCIDCHVGNPQKGMFVTHTMYAAGHPPLANFELETFCEAMPRHWRSESEQVEAFAAARYPQADEYFRLNFPGLMAAAASPESVAWDSRRLLIGAAASRRRFAEIVAWAADAPGMWGDFALYDCGACHHELRRPSDRQRRGYPAAPGRPRPHEWPELLHDLIGPEEAIDKAHNDLVRAMTVIPFGDREASRAAAAAMVTILDQRLRKFESATPLRTSDLWEALRRLAATPADRLVDYAAARQVVWGVTIAAEELGRDSRLSAQQRQTLDAIAQEIGSWREAEVAARQSSAGIGIGPTLLSARDQPMTGPPLQIELERRARYRPDALEASLARIRRVLAERD